MSQIHYKFRSSKDYDSATFDGHSISVFDLKREILIAKGLKGPDDLALTHAESGEARVPAKPGRGGAQRYLEGSGPIRGGGIARNVFDRPGQNSNPVPTSNSYDAMGSKVFRNPASMSQEMPPAPPVDTSGMTEEEAMRLVFQQEATHWGKTQEGMASATYRPLGKFQSPTRPPQSGGPKPVAGASGSGPPGAPPAPGVPGTHPSPYHNRPSMDQQIRPPPSTYVCYRCGKKSEHWIQFCPTNSDKSFRPIGIKKPTGIPRSHLQTVKSDISQSKGLMVTPDGSFVVAQTNDSAWKKFHEKSKGTLTSEEAYATAPVPEDMRCPICRMLLKSAVEAPCCGTNFCDECVRNYLVSPPKGEEPFKCQKCHKDLVPDQLMPSYNLRQRVEQHLRDWAKGRLESDSTGGTLNNSPRGGTPTMTEDTQAAHASPAAKDSSTDVGAAQSDHDKDSWKNKKLLPNNFNVNNGHNTPYNTNVNRNRVNTEMIQQHDPAFFMDPAFFGANGMPPFMMPPGFVPPFGPNGGAHHNQWDMGMGRGMANLPPMGPGFPPPRIGFNDDRNTGPGNQFGAGRGRGRGSTWQGSNGVPVGRGHDPKPEEKSKPKKKSKSEKEKSKPKKGKSQPKKKKSEPKKEAQHKEP
ncbi:E3 ubiquitin-protein ligase rbbp6 [Podila epigama]|nr:E3 ubiquitin-protein ligase rbbp6 [Podila epigama]